MAPKHAASASLARPRPPGAVDPSLRGWLLVILGGTDAILGRIDTATDDPAAMLNAEDMIREEMLAGGSQTATLRPAYAIGTHLCNVGPVGIARLEPLDILHPLGRALSLRKSGATETHVTLACFQFCAEWHEDDRRDVAKRIEQANRAALAATQGFIATLDT